MKPDPGRVTARRLNRAEYTNTIRDLLAIDFRADKNFPTDDSGDGFDNIGDILTVSPVLMEKYLSAAGRIAERAIAAEPLPKPIEVEYSLRFKNLRRLDPSNVEATHRFDFDADYDLRIGLPGQRAKDALPVTLGLWVDGKLTHTMPIETKPSGLVYFNPYSEEQIRVAAARKAITRSGSGSSTTRSSRRSRTRTSTRTPSTSGSASVTDRRAVPVDRTRSRAARRFSSAIRRRVRPASIGSSPTLARRAYRRPVTRREVAGLTRFVALATDDGQSVEQGIAPGDSGDARVAALPLPHRARSQPERPDADAPDLGRGAGVEAELLPVELDAGRRAAVAGGAAPAARAGRARRAGEADARRSEGVGAGRELRRPVAGNPESRQHQAGPAEVPGVGARAPRRDEDGDADVLRRDPPREPSDRRLPRRALHVPQRAAGEALRHRRRDRAGLPARRAHDRPSAAACSARAACSPCRAIPRGRRS